MDTLVAVDGSGSIESSQFNGWITDLKEWRKNGKTFDVVSFDSDVNPLDLDNPVRHAGGSSISKLFEYVSDHNYDSLVVFTDGLVS